MKGFAMEGLYFVTDTLLCQQAGRTVENTVAAAIKGGSRVIQLRDKDMEEDEFRKLALSLRRLTKRHNAILIINDRVQAAREINAEGIHLGQDDMNVLQAREILGPKVIIGLSVETMEQAQAAIALPVGIVNYLGVSPVFGTQTKTDFQHSQSPWGLEGLRELRALTSLPLVAIGGINLQNARSVVAAGADSIAVVSAICSAEDPCGVTTSFAKLFQ